MYIWKGGRRNEDIRGGEDKDVYMGGNEGEMKI